MLVLAGIYYVIRISVSSMARPNTADTIRICEASRIQTQRAPKGPGGPYIRAARGRLGRRARRRQHTAYAPIGVG